MEGTGSPGIMVISLEGKEMDKLKKELEVLKSWGIESVPVDKVLSMIEGEEVTFRFPLGEQSTVISSAIVDVSPVGGTIFYIDDTADGIYEFFDAGGNPIKDVKVGDRPYSYRVIEKGSKDKYYIYHDGLYDDMRWTYCKTSFVYESLDTSDSIGSGKTNTEIMMARDNGAYVTANSSGCPTIWYQLQQVRNERAGGCNDWFVPSKGEVEALRLAIKSGSITGGEIAGVSYEESIFSKSRGYYIWSSSEYSLKPTRSQPAWYWNYNNQSWYTNAKCSRYSVFFTRAF